MDVSIDRLWNTLQVDDEIIDDINLSNCLALIDTHPIHCFCIGICTDAAFGLYIEVSMSWLSNGVVMLPSLGGSQADCFCSVRLPRAEIDENKVPVFASCIRAL